MEKEQRTRLQKATQDARRLLEEEFRSQLLQTYDIDVDKVRWAEEPGAHLLVEQQLIREKLIAWIEHKEAQINDRKEALLLALREMAFTALNRFVALKLMEARELVRPCVSGGLESAGFLEFTAVAQGLLADQESSYRLYVETIFEDVSRELRALFDPRDPASLLWPKRAALLELLEILNHPELAELWSEDETLGWVYQYFNGDAERKKMREESAAPRNSRELAVRNQFFTPRYVVEFLTDNTLGRIWYEMRQGQSGLKERCRYLVRWPNEIWLDPGEEPSSEVAAGEALSQEELLRQPVHIPHRQLKDPREIRMLDPACGSMHFGLYAFDLYLDIYAEAWEIAQAPEGHAKQSDAFAPFAAYARRFANKTAFLRETPKLILQHNIHGIDIDPRATQIARLALWLRAQRAWQEQQLMVADRPQITRSNVVCAEPMPGEKALLREFLEQQFPADEKKAFGFLLETVFDRMTIAGEAGSLLRIEEEIRSSVAEAKRLWKAGPQYDQPGFFAEEQPSNTQQLLSLDLSGITDKQFWDRAEHQIYQSLSDYAAIADEATGFRRGLFTNDAASGFALIDLINTSFDAILANPPFGGFTPMCDKSPQGRVADSGNNLFSSFVERGIEFLAPNGILGAITPRTGFFLSSFQDWREQVVLSQTQANVVADLGLGVMDGAFVEAAAYCLSKRKAGERATTLFLRVLKETVSKEAALLRIVESAPHEASESEVFVCDCKAFTSIPGSPFAYWINHEVRSAFASFDVTQANGRAIKVGDHPGDSFRFLRLMWEIPLSCEKSSWTYYQKGGTFSPYYAEIPYVVDWDVERQSYKGFLGRAGRSSDKPSNFEFFFRPGLTWSRRTNRYISMRVFPAGCIFSDKGPVAFIDKDEKRKMMSFLAITNSKAYSKLLDVQLAVGDAKIGGLARSYEVGLVQRTPFPSIAADVELELAELAYEAWQIYRSRDLVNETSLCFVAPLLHLDAELSLRDIATSHDRECARRFQRIEEIQNRIDDISMRLYGISPTEDSIELESLDTLFEENEGEEEVDGSVEGNTSSSVPFLGSLWSRNLGLPNASRRLLSWLVGVAFGRWDLCQIFSALEIEVASDPFEAIPKYSPANLLSTSSNPVWDAICKDLHNKSLGEENTQRLKIIANDSGDTIQMGRLASAIIRHIWGERGSLIEEEVLESLSISALEEWYSRPSNFFDYHLKGYSRRGRQAPIYWLIGIDATMFWIYYPDISSDTLFRLLSDFIEPRIERCEIEKHETQSKPVLSDVEASRLQKLEAVLHALRRLRNELNLVTPLWSPSLNDGVIINYSILWRITPYAPWQKKCKECWDKLVKGDYDWAHLAFHLWPERVVPKCTTDRSLAIAHGLEDRLWQETNNGNWLPRQLSEADLQALIAEHSNPAVKNALERFLAAPPPVAPTRTRASRSTRSTGSSAPRRPRGTAAVVDAEATRQVLLALTAAPSDGLAKAAIADLIGVEANALTAVIKQLKDSGQIDQLGERRGARYVLSEQGRTAVEQEEAG